MKFFIEREANQFCESKLEEYRPRNAIPRKNAIFMCDNPADIDHARSYWNALPNDIGEPRRDLIEYLAISARILFQTNL